MDVLLMQVWLKTFMIPFNVSKIQVVALVLKEWQCCILVWTTSERPACSQETPRGWHLKQKGNHEARNGSDLENHFYLFISSFLMRNKLLWVTIDIRSSAKSLLVYGKYLRNARKIFYCVLHVRLILLGAIIPPLLPSSPLWQTRCTCIISLLNIDTQNTSEGHTLHRRIISGLVWLSRMYVLNALKLLTQIPNVSKKNREFRCLFYFSPTNHSDNTVFREF